jgi:hypothetical protein
VLAIQPADDEAHAIEFAEGTRFGSSRACGPMTVRASRASRDGFASGV